MRTLFRTLFVVLTLVGGIHAIQLPPQLPRNLRVSAGVDSTNPVITITAPTSGTTYDAGTTQPLTTLAGTCTDNVAVSSVAWVNSAGGSGGTVPCSAGAFSVPSITLTSGVTNTVTVTATDTSGNTHQDALDVSYTTPGGEVIWFQSFNTNCAEQNQATNFNWRQGNPITCDPSNGAGAAGLVTMRRNQNTCTEGTNGLKEYCLSQANLDATGAHPEQIATAANYSGGAGGNGQRHWIGHSWHAQNNSGGIDYSFGTDVTEFSIRWYARWATGLNLGTEDGTSANHKLLYASGGNCNNGGTGCYWDLTPTNMHLVHGTTDPAGECDGVGFDDLYPGGVSDGTWHQLELRWKAPSGAGNDGEVQFWWNGVEMCHGTGLRFNSAGGSPSTGFERFAFPSNHGYTVPSGDGPYPGPVTYTGECACPANDLPTDIDDIAIRIGSGSGPIGAYSAGRGY